jgi:hypothetical protein
MVITMLRPTAVYARAPDLRRVAGRAPQNFAGALRAAIQATGLTLDRIQYRLRQRGVPVTLTSLSYWQSGRRQPERPESVLAVEHLEEVLGLATGALTGLLGPPRPRGRRPPATRSVPVDALWPNRKLITPLLSGMQIGADTGIRLLSLHDRIELAADRGQLRSRVRQVVQAQRNGVDRWISIYDLEHPGQPLPELVPISSCRPGRTAKNHEAGVVVTEWLFETPLDRGETLIMEFERIHSGPPYPRCGDMFTRRLRQPVRHYIAEVQFHPSALPTFCRQYETDPDGTNATRPIALTVSPSGHAHTVRLDTGPGACCVVWGW